jgi:hypothetical protein
MTTDISNLSVRVLNPHITLDESLALARNLVRPTDQHIDRIVTESEVGMRPDGSHVYTFLRNALPIELARVAYPIARRASLNNAVIGGTRFRAAGVRPTFQVLKDGSLGKRKEVAWAEHLVGATDGVIGALEKPVCRTTELTTKDMDEYRGLLPMMRRLQDLYRESCPKHFQKQAEFAGRVDPSYLIEGTIFSTITANRNWPTSFHTDSGDLESGRGVLTAFNRGNCTGQELVLPHYRVAIRYGLGDVLIMDNHEVHGSLPLLGTGDYERIVLVCYLRRNLLKRCPAI